VYKNDVAKPRRYRPPPANDSHSSPYSVQTKLTLSNIRQRDLRSASPIRAGWWPSSPESNGHTPKKWVE